ncbi:MAG: YicC family protein [Candidatus Glassbacteria bacterium]|nr:YicC family protein [Candidatus Glassbacteria bacterium]
MINSMTGFGRGEITLECGTFAVEIKTVNHRYSDFNIRTPRSMSSFEPRIKEMIRKRLTRGYVTYQLSWDTSENGSSQVVLNEEMISRYLELFGRLKDKFGIGGEVSLEMITRLSDAFKTETQEFDEKQLWQGVQQATSLALDALTGMRASEGKTLADDLNARIDEMEKHMGQAAEKGPERLKKLRDDLRTKVLEAVGDEQVDENRLVSEVTYYADKWDFSEEDVRFAHHLSAMRETISKGGVVGRKLNFLVQELNREANTVGSKANDAEIAQLMVAVKEELEKVREQVENIE